MSGFAYNLKLSTAITPVALVHNQEAAGKAGGILGIIAAVVMPFAAPAIFGAIASSGVLGAGLAAAAQAGTMGLMTSVIGSAAVGGILNAGIAYASGARGGDVWKAAGMGAIQGGGGAFARGSGLAAAAKPGAAGLNTSASTMGKVATNAWGDTVNAVGQTVTQTAGAVAQTGATTVSGTVMNGIRSMFGGSSGIDLNRIGAAIVNAAVNGKSMGRLDGLVAQQRAELDALAQSNHAAYVQRITAAQQILADADKMDPSWMARTRMADVAGIEANQFRQAMRNIATTQGNLNTGQRKAYERSGALHAGRSKALAYNTGWGQGAQAQTSMRAQGMAGLQPDTFGLQIQQAGLDLGAAQVNAHNAADQSTAAGFASGIFGTNFNPAPSGDPSEEDNGNDQTGIFGQFGRG